MKRYKFLIILIFCIGFLDCKSQGYMCSGKIPPLISGLYSNSEYMQSLKSNLKLTPSDTLRSAIMGSAYFSVKNNTDSIADFIHALQITFVSSSNDTVVPKLLDGAVFQEGGLPSGRLELIANQGGSHRYGEYVHPVHTSFVLNKDTLYTMELVFFSDSTYKLIGPKPYLSISNILKSGR